MIVHPSVIRLMIRTMSAFGLIRGERDAADGHGGRVDQRDCPFVLVACAPDGRWGVFQRDFDRPQASFGELQEACDYADELARTRVGAMVLIRKQPDSAAGRN